ncbi:DUF4352 domain-containing protein, partial [Mycobacteroides immunogenum]
ERARHDHARLRTGDPRTPIPHMRSSTFMAIEPQKLIAGGKTFSADSTASMYIGNDALMAEINPGNKIDVQVAFDVPVGTEPDQVKLHDSAFSGGVAVDLKRTN